MYWVYIRRVHDFVFVSRIALVSEAYEMARFTAKQQQPPINQRLVKARFATHGDLPK